jgi:hypothetical protein
MSLGSLLSAVQAGLSSVACGNRSLVTPISTLWASDSEAICERLGSSLTLHLPPVIETDRQRSMSFLFLIESSFSVQQPAVGED